MSDCDCKVTPRIGMGGVYGGYELEYCPMHEVAPALLEACEVALSFISNGIELGYITMPDLDTPDSAHATPDVLRSAIAAATAD